MELIRLAIPAAFILARVQPSWRLVRFGLENQLIARQAVLDIAQHEFARVEQPAEPLAELMWRTGKEPVLDEVVLLAERERSIPDTELLQVWLYLVMAWLFEHRAESDYWRLVEYVYADFGYPDEIREFVSWMPSSRTLPGGREAAEAARTEDVRVYLEACATIYGPPATPT
jgi:hypothetical protein